MQEHWGWGFYIDLNAAVYIAFPQELTRVLLALISSVWFPIGINTGPLGYRLEFNKYAPYNAKSATGRSIYLHRPLLPEPPAGNAL